jgi:hypothetical protein
MPHAVEANALFLEIGHRCRRVEVRHTLSCVLAAQRGGRHQACTRECIVQELALRMKAAE